MKTELIFDGPADASTTLVLTHGAGAAMDTAFMNAIAQGVSGAGYRVARFEFPYMAKRRVDGRKRGPDRQSVLMETWKEVIDSFGERPLVIGGKSLGGRIASMVAEDCKARGLVCLGYPFHPPGKPVGTRVDHLRRISIPTLILQGTRDTFGTPAEVAGYELSRSVEVVWLEDGDHGFRPRKRSGRTEQDNMELATRTLVEFLRRRE